MSWVGVDREATGSPQPPPGGGLLLDVAGPSARLRACLGQKSMPVAVEVVVGKIGRAAISGPQPPVGVKMLADTFGRAATGGPQPPPGGGLQLASRRSARTGPPLGCGAALSWNRSVRTERAAASPREGPLLASALASARAGASQAASRVSRGGSAARLRAGRRQDRSR